MSDVADETKYDGEPQFLQTEESICLFRCEALQEPDGKRHLAFSSTWLPSLPYVVFGLCLKPETTQQEAEALADHINKHCPAMYGMFYDRSLTDEFYELNEYGLVKQGSC
jgi:hypothetical protein